MAKIPRKSYHISTMCKQHIDRLQWNLYFQSKVSIYIFCAYLSLWSMSFSAIFTPDTRKFCIIIALLHRTHCMLFACFTIIQCIWAVAFCHLFVRRCIANHPRYFWAIYRIRRQVTDDCALLDWGPTRYCGRHHHCRHIMDDNYLCALCACALSGCVYKISIYIICSC